MIIDSEKVEVGTVRCMQYTQIIDLMELRFDLKGKNAFRRKDAVLKYTFRVIVLVEVPLVFI